MTVYKHPIHYVYMPLLTLPINTGPGSSGAVTSAALTTEPLGRMTSFPLFNSPSSGPGGTPALTHFSSNNAPACQTNKIILQNILSLTPVPQYPSNTKQVRLHDLKLKDLKILCITATLGGGLHM